MSYLRVTAPSGLRIRSGPGTDYDELDKAEFGSVLETSGEPARPGWKPVLMEDGTTGWASALYLDDANAGDGGNGPSPGYGQGGLPILQGEMSRRYGTPDYGQWARANLVTVDLSEFSGALAHVRTFDGKPFRAVLCHRALEAPLLAALRLVVAGDLAGKIKTFGGCFDIRPMRAGASPSMHSWAFAIDLNAATNPFMSPGSKGWPALVTDFSKEFIACWARCGWEWGGLWQTCHDAMHFQLAWTRDWRSSDNPLAPRLPGPASTAAPQQAWAPDRDESSDFSTPDFSTRAAAVEAIRLECARQGLALPAQVAYVLATAEHETAGSMKPVREAYYLGDEDRAEAYRKGLEYYPYYGRGLVQLTWRENYEAYGPKLSKRFGEEVDLVESPDDALRPDFAVFILVDDLRTGAFTGKRLSDYVSEETTNFVDARRCVNGVDKADEIAAMAEKFLEA